MFVPLFASELRRQPLQLPRPGLAWCVLAIALAAELLLLAGGFTRASRAFIPVAAVGLGLLLGRPDLRTSAILLFFVPVPHILVSRASTTLEAGLATAATTLLRLAGMPALLEAGHYHTTLHIGNGSFSLLDVDGGVPLAALLFGLTWYLGCRREWTLLSTVARAVPIACLAAPIQVAAIFCAALLLRAGLVSDPRLFLDLAPWLLVVAVALFGPCRPARAGLVAAPSAQREPLS